MTDQVVGVTNQAAGTGVVGLTASTSLVFVGRSIGGAGYTDVLAVDTGDTLNVSTGYDLQVDAVPGDQIVFVGKSSAAVV